ncbi:MAG: CDP-2,3-bis-(O-geranylgeranyl)-sn-glycerol synthase [Candidatus Micrarchaeota archaeon]|nr:CDP-2,3-bis-(O-geranylgeranyl)-sn-glycerol synthase [Candidatus Micrarchaeota archaeon]
MIPIYFIEAIWFILPAYAANGFAPLFRGKIPIDGGRNMRDGRRIFGDGKTRKGFLGGCIVGAAIGAIQMLAYPYIMTADLPLNISLVMMSPVLGFLLGFGAMTGDLAGSFVKRRLDIKRGKAAPLLDQIDFLVGAIFFTFLIADIKSQWVLVLLVVTPLFHLVANVIGYFLKVKAVPY